MDMADFMEYLHNAAASINTYSAEMAKKYADTRRKVLEHHVLTWVNNILQVTIISMQTIQFKKQTG